MIVKNLVAASLAAALMLPAIWEQGLDVSDADAVAEVLSAAGFDAASLATAVNRLLGDDTLRQRMAGRSRELVSSVFHVDTMCRSMLALYRRLLAQRGQG